jgi:hypothetical protein
MQDIGAFSAQDLVPDVHTVSWFSSVDAASVFPPGDGIENYHYLVFSEQIGQEFYLKNNL